MPVQRSIFLVLIIIMGPLHSLATHLRAGEITAERVSCSSLTFRITITVFIDTESGVTFGDGFLYFGDGEDSRVPVPDTPTTPRPDLGENMGTASFTITHTYSGYGNYTISYSEENRNEDVVNMFNSVFTPFYVETKIFLDPFFSCNQSLPELKVPPIDGACSGVAFFHNPGAFDQDGDSLSYEIAIPQQATDRPVFDYKDPNDIKFYVDYQTGNEENGGPPTFSINPLNGILKWDAPGHVGEYNIAFRVVEWRKDRAGVWQKMSYVTRDMQIIVEDCDNERPDLIIPNDTCVTAGTVLEETIFGIDPENHPVKIEVFSEVLNLFVSPATFSPAPAFRPSSPPAELHFRWNTDCEHVKEQYYNIVFKITDNPGKGPKLVTFKSWRVKVVGPPPVWDDAQLDPGKRSATLKWDEYICSNATTMQVWRRIDSFPYSPANCETGMPEFLGYKLVSLVPLKDQSTGQVITQFVDTNEGKGLAPGAAYCYRLVAVFPDPKGGESYLSTDTCLAPIQADAPVITHVTVEQTGTADGAIRISWYSPFQISKTQFPGPYEYAVYRADDFQGETGLLPVTPENRIRDTTFVDGLINTRNRVYNYRIVLYSNTATDPTAWVPVDTSAVASSVRLEAGANAESIELDWKAEVPWLNVSERFPYHLVYRGNSTDEQSQFLLIDSVAVAADGFRYEDRGQYLNMPLDKNKTYCYRILTRGTYGNPLIQEPLENYSQIICRKPDDQEKPCTPVLAINKIDCDELFASSQCLVTEFSNRIFWSTACEDDADSYRIYASAGPDREFVMLAENVKDTFYIDQHLTSFARCYKVVAVDAQGNESEESESVCNDNCPYFALPNVFTPNGDECNEYFSAYGPFNPIYNQTTPESCVPGYENITQCIRFVKQVSFKVYNRWGKEVYTYKSSGEKSIYINWDGRDNENHQLSSGVYYYLANVTFDTLDPGKQNQIFKGWIQLLR